MIASLAMVLSSITVILNTLRLKNKIWIKIYRF
jgi:cation transport ATPase